MEVQKPKLAHLAAFEQLLAHYKVSDHARAVLAATPFVAMMSVAGGGRNTLINYLVETGPYYFVVSDTTRPPKIRNGITELDGVHYFFRTEEDFLADLKTGEFIEAEIIHGQQVSGTSIREVEKAKELGLIPIHDYEFGGIDAMQSIKNDAVVIALLPPSFEDWQYRLKNRETMHSNEFKNRMQTAVHVLQAMLERPYVKFVISGDLNDSSLHLRDIVEKGLYTEDDHSKGKSLTQAILSKTQQLLTEL
jgi:guanylate kinase